MIEYCQFVTSNGITDSSHDHQWLPKPNSKVIPEKGYSYGTQISPLGSPVHWKGKWVIFTMKRSDGHHLNQVTNFSVSNMRQSDITCLQMWNALWSIKDCLKVFLLTICNLNRIKLLDLVSEILIYRKYRDQKTKLITKIKWLIKLITST